MTDKLEQTKNQSAFKTKTKAINKVLASQLKEDRTTERYTMRNLSGHLGVPHSFIGKIEQMGRRLDIGEFILYCRAMGKDPVEILKTVIKQSKS